MKILPLAGAAVAAIVVILVVLSVFSPSESDKNQVRVAFFANISHAVPIVGIENGYFEQKLGETQIKTKIVDSGPEAVEALFANSTGVFSTAVGYRAGYANTTGGVHAFGTAVLYANTTGSANTGIGYQSLQFNTTGTSNTGVGYAALNANVTGNLYANGSLVVTDVTPSPGPGISLSNVSNNGYHPHFTINNTGVLSLIPGTGISLSGNTGNVTVSTTGTSYINVIGVTGAYTPTSTDEYIGVFSANAVTITLPNGIDGRVYTIKDEYGQGSGKITIQPQATELIDSKVNYIISVPYQSVSCVFRAGQWRII